MFKNTFWGVDEKEVLDYMDRLLAVVEHQRSGAGTADQEILVRQLRKELAKEGRLLKRRKRQRRILSVIGPLVCLELVILICSAWFGVAAVTGDSMSPVLRTGDIVIYTRQHEEYRRGDLVVCEVEHTSIVKRVAGEAGDVVDQDQNGNVKIESQGENGYPGKQGQTETMILREEEYFVLGDNRELSVDSRDSRVGPVKKSQIKGRVFLVIRAIG